MAVLAEVVEAMAGRAKIVIDGGFMRGTDIVKARPLCLEPASGVALASVVNHCRTGAVQKFVYVGSMTR